MRERFPLILGAGVLLACGMLGAACGTFGSDADPPDNGEAGGGDGDGNDGDGGIADGNVITADAPDDPDASSKCRSGTVNVQPAPVVVNGENIVDLDVDDTGIYWTTGSGIINTSTGAGKAINIINTLGVMPAHLVVTAAFVVVTTAPTSDGMLHAFGKGSPHVERLSGNGVAAGSQIVWLSGDQVVVVGATGGLATATAGMVMGTIAQLVSPPTPTVFAGTGTEVFFTRGQGLTAITLTNTAGQPVAVTPSISAIGFDASHVYFMSDKSLWSVARPAPSPGLPVLVGTSNDTSSNIAIGTRDVYVVGKEGVDVIPKTGGCAPVNILSSQMVTQLKIHDGKVTYASAGTLAQFPELP